MNGPLEIWLVINRNLWSYGIGVITGIEIEYKRK
jgi:hypothetical protein